MYFLAAWNDGKIRVYKAFKGALLLTIENAHKETVTAIAGFSDSRRIVSGGGEGQVSLCSC